VGPFGRYRSGERSEAAFKLTRTPERFIEEDTAHRIEPRHLT